MSGWDLHSPLLSVLRVASSNPTFSIWLFKFCGQILPKFPYSECLKLSLPIPSTKMGNFLPSLTQIIPFWPPDGYLGLIRSPSRVQRPVSAVKIPHSPLSPLSSAKQPVSEDVPEIKGHTAALGALTQCYSPPHHYEYSKISNESFNLPTAFSLKRKGLPFNNFPP